MAGVEGRYRPETGCAAQALLRGDSLVATAPPAARWLLIESRHPWPRNALTTLEYPPLATHEQLLSGSNAGPGKALGAEVARLCGELGYRPVVIRRFGRVDGTTMRRWAIVDSRAGRESVQWGELPTDEHLLDVLADRGLGTASAEPIYLVCTHGRRDACCAVHGRPVAAALAAAYSERTWECSHVGGDRFAANVVVLPHALFYGHVPAARAVELAKQYDEGAVVPDLLRGSGAFIPSVQAAQHFVRAGGESLAINDLRPRGVQQLPDNHWQVFLTSPDGSITVEVSAHLDTVDARMTCSSPTPSQVRRFELHAITRG